MRLRMRVNERSLVQIANICSNGIQLSANIYLAANGFRSQVQSRRTERTMENLQTAAEIANAIAGLTQIVTTTLDKHHAKGG